MNNIQHRRAVVVIKAGADGRGGLRYISDDGVARFCVIGSLYSRVNKAFLKRGEAHSRDIYRQVAIKYGMDRNTIYDLLAINDRIPWTWLRRLALLRYLTRITHE
jgi:hypothetical protein